VTKVKVFRHLKATFEVMRNKIQLYEYQKGMMMQNQPEE